jgi:23S rRNA pseudouridine2605 synthase
VAERIQKVLADSGIASRREIDRWVVEGRVTIDGRSARPGDRLSGRERVCVDGRPIKSRPGAKRQRRSFLAYYKPSGEPAHQEEQQRPTSRLPGPAPPKHGRWINVAALDTSAAGLLFLTTDGKLADKLMRARASIDQEYALRLLGQLTPAQCGLLTDGVELDDGVARLDSLTSAGGAGSNIWYHCVLREGGSRELRDLFAAAGVAVSRMIRVRYGPLKLGDLRRGDSRPLNRSEIDSVYRAADSPRAKNRPMASRLAYR